MIREGRRFRILGAIGRARLRLSSSRPKKIERRDAEDAESGGGETVWKTDGGG